MTPSDETDDQAREVRLSNMSSGRFDGKYRTNNYAASKAGLIGFASQLHVKLPIATYA